MVIDLPLSPVFGWRPKIDTCQIAVGSAATGIFIVFILWVFVFDRTPPFQYLGGAIEPSLVHEGETVTRWRLVSWKRADCEIEISGHIIDQGDPPASRETDRFSVPRALMEQWVQESRAGKPHRFTRDMIARMPVHPDGTKAFPIGPDGKPGAAQLCYTSLDYATCNWAQRLWPFRRWPGPIEIDGPMMCFKVLPSPAG